MYILYTKEAQRGIKLTLFYDVQLLKKDCFFFSPASAFTTSFWNAYYRDRRIYMMKLLLRFFLPPE